MSEGSEQQHRGDLLLGERLSGSDAIHIGHTNIHNDQVRTQFACQIDRAQTIPCFSNDEIALFGQYILQIHALDCLVICNNNSCWHSSPQSLWFRPSDTTWAFSP